MCKATDVASYILQEKGRLTTYQLQKLLYYSQAWCLVTQDRPLFSEDILAWQHGLVVHEVFSEHAGRRSIVSRDISGDADLLSPEDCAVVDAVLEEYGVLTGKELEALSHSEAPWASVFDHGSSVSSPIITKDSMLKYYSTVMASDSGTRAAHHVPRFTYAPRVFVSDEELEWLRTLVDRL